MAIPEYDQFHPMSRQEWRQWLLDNHQQIQGIWFVYYKKETGKPRVSYDEAVEEALCFGWIDSLPRKLDHERSMLKFTIRKPKSVWSALNKKRVTKLIRDKQMMPAGMKSIQIAKANGSWDTLSETDQLAATGKIPTDLEKLFARNKKAATHFSAFSESVRRQFLYWINSAKRPETRKARLEQTVLVSAANKKPGANGFKL